MPEMVLEAPLTFMPPAQAPVAAARESVMLTQPENTPVVVSPEFAAPVFETEAILVPSDALPALESAAPSIASPVSGAKRRFQFKRASKLVVRKVVLVKRERKPRPPYVKAALVEPKSSRAMLASMLSHFALAILIVVFVPPVMKPVLKVVYDEPQVVMEMPVEEPEIEVAAGKNEPQVEKSEETAAPVEPLKEPPVAQEEVAKVEEIDLTTPVNPIPVQDAIAVATDHGPLMPSADAWKAAARRTVKPAPAKVVSNAYVKPGGTGSGLGDAPVFVSANTGVGVPGGKSNGARLIGSIDPKYPSEMKDAKKTATVKLRLFLDVKGKIQRVEVISTEVEAAFIRAADAAVRKAKFEPAITNGAAVESTIRVSVEFKLE